MVIPMSDYKDKDDEPVTACQWIDNAIQNTEKTARSYRKIIEMIEARKIKTSDVPQMIFVFELKDEEQSAKRTIERIVAQERGHLDFLGMVKRDLKCEQ